MHCTSCGAEVAEGAGFCARCGRAVAAAAPTVVQFKRPAVISVLAVLQFIGAAAFLPIGIIAAIALMLASPRDPLAIAGCVILFVGGVFMLLCGIGLWRLKPYGRILQLIGASIGLLAIPLGTLISIAILVYLNKPGIKLLFSGRPEESLSPEERAQVVAMQTSSGGVVAIVVIAGLLLLSIPLVGIIAAIAIPGLLRARIAANEASAIGTLRAFQSAEAAFSAASGGPYGTPECLVSPNSCLPRYTGGAFISDELSSSDFSRSGYRFHFAPGAAGESAGLTRSFAVYATPVSSGTGTRVFCTDDRGSIVSERASSSGTLDTGPVCPSDWTPMPIR